MINQGLRRRKLYLMHHQTEVVLFWARIKSSSWKLRVLHRAPFSNSLQLYHHLKNNLNRLPTVAINSRLQLKKSQIRINSADFKGHSEEVHLIYITIPSLNTTLMEIHSKIWQLLTLFKMLSTIIYLVQMVNNRLNLWKERHRTWTLPINNHDTNQWHALLCWVVMMRTLMKMTWHVLETTYLTLSSSL